MVIGINVVVDTRNVDKLFKNLPVKTRKEVGNGMFQIAKSYQRSLRYSLRQSSKKFDGTIFNSIQAVKKNDINSVVTMAQEGFWLDSMRPHWVSIYKARKIAAWAQQRGYKGNSIFVRPHPFIERGFNRGRENRERILQQSMDKALKSSKR